MILQAIQADTDLILQSFQAFLDLLGAQSGHGLEFFSGGDATGVLLHLAYVLFQEPDPLTQSAGEPVHAPQFIKHGPLDPVFRVRLELDAHAHLEFFQGFNQAEAAGAEQFSQLDMMRELGLHAQGDNFCLRGIVRDNGSSDLGASGAPRQLTVFKALPVVRC